MINGAFIEKIPFEMEIRENEWSNITLRFTEKYILANNNGRTSKRIIKHKEGGNILIFRGCEQSTCIDDIQIIGKDSNDIFYDDFRKKYTHTTILILAFVCFNFLFILFYRKKSLLLVIILNITIVSLFIALFFEFYGQELYPKEWMIKWQSKTSKIESEESVFTRINSEYTKSAKSDDIKILFTGTSQTWGAGASKEETTFVRRFEELINNSNEGKRIACINTSVAGVNSNVLLKSYKEYWLKLQPEIQILNVALNDAGQPEFKNNLEKFINLNIDNNIKTILVLEPIAVFNKGHYHNHDIIREMAKKYNIQVIDMQNYLKQHYDDGFVWCDFIHLSDFGHQLFAEKLFKDLKDMIQEY
ncbi:SGNH/GDSL hydrolase family protein [candidate division KSB1 bacterium]